MGHNSINKTARRVDITSNVKYRISRARVGAVDVQWTDMARKSFRLVPSAAVVFELHGLDRFRL